MALIRNVRTNSERNEAIGNLMTEKFGANFAILLERPKRKPYCFYYGNDNFQISTYPFRFNQTYEEFIGGLTTASFMPPDEHPLYDKLETKAKEVFDDYSIEGFMIVEGETELVIGQPIV